MSTVLRSVGAVTRRLARQRDLAHQMQVSVLPPTPAAPVAPSIPDEIEPEVVFQESEEDALSYDAVNESLENAQIEKYNALKSTAKYVYHKFLAQIELLRNDKDAANRKHDDDNWSPKFIAIVYAKKLSKLGPALGELAEAVNVELPEKNPIKDWTDAGRNIEEWTNKFIEGEYLVD